MNEELRTAWDELRQTLRSKSPARIVKQYDSLSPEVRDGLVAFRPYLNSARVGETIRNGASALDDIAMAYGTAVQTDRRILIDAALQTLVALGVSAGDPASQAALASIGRAMPAFVVEGTLAQQFVCKLAIHIGSNNVHVPALLEALGAPFVESLSTVVEIGAPITRDIAVEALGAILKLRPDLEKMFPLRGLAPTGDAHIDRHSTKLERRRLMSLTIAGHPLADGKLVETLRQSPENDYEMHSDWLRILPAVWRQATLRKDCEDRRAECIAILRRAAVSAVSRGAEGQTLTRFVYQESVFRTIEVMIDRGASAAEFDDVVARGLMRLRSTVVGSAVNGNAETRASVAVICTAAKIVTNVSDSKAEAALRELFEYLRQSRSPWANPGVVEGCFRSLPSLLTNHLLNVWTKPALDELFAILKTKPHIDNLVETHRRLFATSCFRRLLTTLIDRMYRQLLDFHTPRQEEVYERNLDQALSLLLSQPTTIHVLEVFQPDYNPAAGKEDETPDWLSEIVLAAAAFETELLEGIERLFGCWDSLREPQQLLLTRILAAQLRSHSHDARDLRRYPQLRTRFDAIPSVVLSERKRQDKLLHLLSSLPQKAAESAHEDLQEFVEHVSRRPLMDVEQHRNVYAEHDVNDLPGYVLAMISESVSHRLASDIAREVDLNLRHARDNDPQFDLAISLYQVTLRGPNVAVFDHVLPRMRRESDRQLVLLFRKHVLQISKSVDHPPTGEPRIQRDRLIDSINAVCKDITRYQNDRVSQEEQPSKTLSDLALALALFLNLMSEQTPVWCAIEGKTKEGGLHELLRQLDNVANETHVRHREILGQHQVAVEDADNHPNNRQPFAELCCDECVQLREDVSHYIRLPIRLFTERHRTLHHAVEIVDRIEKKLKGQRSLQPPEQIMLLALLDYWRQLFFRTTEWYVDAPQRCVETKRPEVFWRMFAEMPRDPHAEADRRRWLAQAVVDDVSLLDGQLEMFLEERYGDWAVDVTAADLGLTGTAPAPIDDQLVAFERHYVDWMSAELDIDHLTWALHARWPQWFKRTYLTITRFRHVLTFMALPFLWVIVMDLMNTDGTHAIEGLGFFVYAIVLISGGLFVLTSRARRRLSYAWRKRRNRTSPEDEEPQREYLFQCILPSLFRLIVVPLALLVDFEHSYHFPMEASNSVIVLLMILAFLTTAYFVTREVLGHDADQVPSSKLAHDTPGRQHVRQIVAVALAHSFALSLIFSFIFESNYVRWIEQMGKSTAAVSAPVMDSLRSQYHSKPFFLGVLPREATFHVSKLVTNVLELFGTASPSWLPSDLRFDFYPTLILAWTALGLFFGVFLEGFLKGEKLRGEMAR